MNQSSGTSPAEQLHDVISKLLSGRLPVDVFCERFERLYNLSVDKPALTAAERDVFSRLFDEVALYSPFPDDRSAYPGYRDEAAIVAAAKQAWESLADHTAEPQPRQGGHDTTRDRNPPF